MSKELAELAAAYVRAKAQEAIMADQRRAIAAKIQALTGHTAEGQKTYAADQWKVTVKAPLIRSMNWDAWEQVKGRIPEDLWPVEMKPSLDEKGVKWLQNNEPETYAVLSEALIIKPGSVQITVQEVK
jgi:hypothetical protein